MKGKAQVRPSPSKAFSTSANCCGTNSDRLHFDEPGANTAEKEQHSHDGICRPPAAAGSSFQSQSNTSPVPTAFGSSSVSNPSLATEFKDEASNNHPLSPLHNLLVVVFVAPCCHTNTDARIHNNPITPTTATQKSTGTIPPQSNANQASFRIKI